MASVINSARTSTADVFGFVGAVANTATKTVGTLSCAIDALDAKARTMRDDVLVSCAAQAALNRDSTVFRVASEHTDLMEEIHRRNYPNQKFDREAYFNAALKRITSAVEKMEAEQVSAPSLSLVG